MKRIFKIVLAICFATAIIVLLKNYYKVYNIEVKDDTKGGRVVQKGIKGARDFVFDTKGNLFIAYKDKIQFIGLDGKSYDIYKDNNMNIFSLDYKENVLYFSSNTKVLSYDLNSKTVKELVKDLPNLGDYKQSIIRIKGNELYISIGVSTNSGVVGKDNIWITDSPFTYDISPKDITIKGKLFGTENTGAFVPYRTKNTNGQVIPGHFPGNGSIVTYNLNSGNLENYAWGIRNVKGMDFNSEGKLLTSVGGMEDRGYRPVKGDLDYIFEIKKGGWYGWPDYSGGDPITSPRFKGQNNTKITFILDNHPTTNPPAPLYQHKQLSTLGCLAVDGKGVLGEKDCIYFYESKDNKVYGLDKKGILKEKVQLNTDSEVSSLKIDNNGLNILDSSGGFLYHINKNNGSISQNFEKATIYYLMILSLLAIIIALWKFGVNNKQ